MTGIFLVVLILLACFGTAIYLLLRWRAKSDRPRLALTYHDKERDLDDSLLQDSDDRKTSFHLIEAAKWPI